MQSIERTGKEYPTGSSWMTYKEKWCNMDMYNIYKEAQNRDCWLTVVRAAVDTNGH